MTFTINIGNPPYSNRSKLDSADGGGCPPNLDSNFFLKCMELSDSVSLIIRSKHFTMSNSTFFRKIHNQLVSIKYLPKSTFPTIKNTETCVVTWKRDHKGPCKVTYMDGTVLDKELDGSTVLRSNDPHFEGVVENNMSHRYMRGSLPRHKIIDVDKGISIVEIINGTTPVVRTIHSDQTDKGLYKNGVIINLNTEWNKLGRMTIKPYDCAISQSVIFLETSGDEESYRLIDYLNSDSVKSKIPSIKKSFSNSKYVFTMIQDIHD